ncbi:MAG: mandelate racemase/muconate lactonizing enzyme family protein [Gemmatimonadetes bacterium]|nr:mandelate racemase/muconate lactonizing enzyme family protein [Gemmatimonadota bacterium]
MHITGIDIDAVDVNGQHHWVFVHVRTDDGVDGLGELNPSAPRSAVLGALRKIEQEVVGKDPRRIEQLAASLKPRPEDRPAVHALCAFEQGLWDILGKSLDAPVHALLGGKCRDSIPVYANVTRAALEGTPDDFVRQATGAVGDGHTAVKIAPFDGRLGSGATLIDHGLQCVHAVREAIGPDINLLLDCYGRFSLDEACRIVDGLRGVDLYWLEEPVGERDLDGYRQIKRATGCRIAGGERAMLIEGFWPLFGARAMDVIMPDVTVAGGIGELKKIASIAESRGQLTAPHGPFGPVTVAAHVQIMASHPAFLILEYAWGQVPWREGLVSPAEQVVNGRINIPDSPGLGLSLEPGVVEAYRVDPMAA